MQEDIEIKVELAGNNDKQDVKTEKNISSLDVADKAQKVEE